MSSRTKNPSKQRIAKSAKLSDKYKKEATRAEFLMENVGREVKHSDRTYKILPSGSWQRLTAKKDAVRNSKNY